MKTKSIQKSIPDGWEPKKFQDLPVAKGLVRGPFGGSLKKEFFKTDGYKVYEQRNAIYQNTNLGNYFVDEEKFFELKRFEVVPGDFIISCSGTIGKIFQIPENAPRGLINQALLKIRVNTNIVNDKYFYYHFVWNKFQAKVIDNTQGGAMQNLVGMDVFRNIKLTLPPLSEQKRIVAVLEVWDSYLEKLAQKIEIKKRIKKGLMQQLLTGEKRLKGFIENWQTVKLGDMCEIRRGGSPRPIQKYLTQSEDGLNWLRIGDIPKGDRYISKTEEKITKDGLNKTTLVNSGDFILSNSMSFGRPYIMKISACIHDGWLALMNVKTNLNKDYLFYLLSSEVVQNKFSSISAGSGVLNLKKESVARVLLTIPKIGEQTAIANLLTKVDDEIDALEKKRKVIESQKKYLLNNLITGAIRTPEDLLGRNNGRN